MESETGNPVSKFFFRIKAEVHGVGRFTAAETFFQTWLNIFLCTTLRMATWNETFLFLLQIYLNLMKCFNYPMRENMMRLAIVWFTLSFGWVPDLCHLCQRTIRQVWFLCSDNGTRQRDLQPHCFSVILISLPCRHCMLSKSIIHCGSIWLHWCLSGSRNGREIRHRFGKKTKQKNSTKNTGTTSSSWSSVISLTLSACIRQQFF